MIYVQFPAGYRRQNSHDLLMQSKIMDVIYKFFKITPEKIKRTSRLRKIVYPRQMAITFLLEYTNLTQGDIAEFFCLTNHTTVIYAGRKIRSLIKQNQKVREDYIAIKYMIENS